MELFHVHDATCLLEASNEGSKGRKNSAEESFPLQ